MSYYVEVFTVLSVFELLLELFWESSSLPRRLNDQIMSIRTEAFQTLGDTHTTSVGISLKCVPPVPGSL